MLSLGRSNSLTRIVTFLLKKQKNYIPILYKNTLQNSVLDTLFTKNLNSYAL